MAEQQLTVIPDDRFPWRQLSVLAICRVVEPIAFCSITAYAYPMVQTIGGEQDASFYAGLLVSAFPAAEACTAWLWGSASDRLGRKPIILVALAGTAITSLTFGLSKQYWLALLIRFIAGCLNGNTAVMQTMVAEIVTNPKHEPRAYAIQPFMWNVGSIAGSALGGFTAQPAESYPKWFSDKGLFAHFPYLLPNIIAAMAMVLALAIGWHYLTETNAALEYVSSTDEKGPISRWYCGMCSRLRSRLGPTDRSRSEVGRQNSLTEPFIPFLEKGVNEDPAQEDSTSQSDEERTFTPQVLACTIALCLMSYHQMAFASLLPTYLTDKVQNDNRQMFHLSGGLEQTLPQVGKILILNSIMSLFCQGLIYPMVLARLGAWRSIVSVLALAPLPYMMAPFITLLPSPQTGIYVILALQSLVTTTAYPVVLILLKNACSSPKSLGRVNGVAMSGCSFTRTLASPLIGLLYGSCGSAIAWWSAGLVAIIGFVQILSLRRLAYTA